MKCANDLVFYESPEYGDVQIGCCETPERKNYYCTLHRGFNLTFNVGKQQISFLPKKISATRIMARNVFIFI